MTYLRNAWYVASWAQDVSVDHPVGVRLLNEPIVVWRNTAGELVVFEDRCIHRHAPLSLGRCEGDRLRCMYHGMQYDRAGRVVSIPGTPCSQNNLRVRSYPVVERHSWIWIWMGDTLAADDGLIPRVAGLDHPGFVFGHSQFDLAAEARLVHDNLLDLSHASFLHLESFRVSESWATSLPKVTQLERSVHIEWWIRNEPPMGSLDRSLPFVDTYLHYEFFVPGVVFISTRVYPAGTADALNGEVPDLKAIEASVSSQAIAPMTDKTTRYFFSMGMPRHGNEQVDMAVTKKAFAEDKTMIEAQQKIIDAAPQKRFMLTGSDRGIVVFNRVVEKLVREELVSTQPILETRT